MTEPAAMHDDGVVVVTHPLVQHKLTLMRERETPTGVFRHLARELSLLLGYEAMRDLPLETVEIDTPLEHMQARRLAGKKLCLISILRAGNGILDGLLDLVPSARVGYVGMYRDPETLEPVEYYLKLPEELDNRVSLVVDPMLATGHSAVAAIDRLKQAGCSNMVFVCLLAAPEGVARLRAAHPDVRIVTCAIDRGLDDHGYIRPGLGDAGDRLFGTR
ncbi:uracil phosphoribosyltransferase [Komagataeibacter melaceti]|uniref:Uracil phosphoribosyltransferase n=1 Tax=Komagataeibacter melaceti TaxID=2766577 RepID=A0A371Z131_9PROT|nr:uracil phosphoribosyltransferase [Komagataeibacter melaceti]RFD20206.1 uracil phosphoribosyltransferase [Komagataeibacter melaceti]